ncbi:Ig-like domain repeat protein [Cellulomonas sp. PhB150]|uniref:Ig-like domain repeat protein n=1 Tax=Cellulomonas sp. PhB150 TaxID=2485188 RepID=UPI001315481E|nr:Ig-like domain repeat protein [Cellulomonas sp. PhB150]
MHWKIPAAAAVAAASLVVSALPALAADDAPAGTVATVSIDSFGGTSPRSREDRALLTDDGRVVPLASDVRAPAGEAADVRALVGAGPASGTSGAAAAGRTTTVARSAAPVAEQLYVVTIQDSTTTGSFSTSRAAAVASSAAAYWKREARGAISSFTVASTVPLALDGSCALDYEEVFQAAADAYPKVDFLAPGKHVVAFSPLGCADDYGYAGVANVGEDFTTGGYVQVIADEWGVLAHELGHHFGLGHADLALQTPTGVAGYEYFGLFGPQALQLDSYAPGALDGAWRAQLGLPGEAAREQVVRWNAAPAVYTLAPLTSSGGRTTLVVNDDTNTPTFFLDYRSGAAGDASTFYASDRTGLLAGWFDEGSVSFRRGVTVSLPIDGDVYTVAFPATSTSYRAAGRTGDELTLLGGDVTLKLISQTAAGAQVQVSYADNPRVSTTAKIAVSTVTERSRAKVTVTVGSARKKASGTVVVYQDGTKIATRTLSGGKVTFSTPKALMRGRHTFSVHYAGTPAFGASKASVRTTVKDASKLRVTTTKVRTGTSATVTARVTSDLKATGTVRVYRGSTYVGKATVKSGRATIHLPRSWKAKSYALTVKYSGSTTVAAASAKATLVVLPKK